MITTNSGSTAMTSTLRIFAIVGALSLGLTGCVSGSDAGGSTDTADSVTEGDSSGTDTDSDTGTSGGAEEVSVTGGDLTTFTALLLATNYAEGRDPWPTVEFLDATTVRFAFPAEVSEEKTIGNCQIAWGVMSGEGIRVLTSYAGSEQDCTATMEE
ncbi:MAG: hypothetical protein ACOH1J_01585 [Microbacteriaceae bacterium]